MPPIASDWPWCSPASAISGINPRKRQNTVAESVPWPFFLSAPQEFFYALEVVFGVHAHRVVGRLRHMNRNPVL